MATFIPDPLPFSATHGEKELARLWRRLPEEWTVYFEPRVQELRPDFVILAPNHGVLVVEVKDWKLSSVKNLTAQEVELQSSKMPQPKRVTNPLQQVTEYWRAVKDACHNSLFGRPLVQDQGPHRGSLCFPVGAAVVFTGISRAEVQRSVHREAWTAIFTTQNSVLADNRRGWEDLDEAGLVAVLKPFFQPFVMPKPFTAKQIDILRWVLFPESRMDVILGGRKADAARVMTVLDTRQEQHARSLGSGHRILFGVAGSGKTVLLLARARWLARERPEQRTLLLCFNKVLAAWLAERISDCPSVTVRHFDGWAKDLGLTRQRADKDNEAFGTRVLDGVRARGDAARSWDTILIDEAQDFEPAWFECALASMKDPENGDLVIVADGCQQLYKPRAFTWKSLGIKAAGRAISSRYDLDKNYRNTPRIAALAFPYSADAGDEDGIQAQRVRPNTCRRYNQTLPAFVAAADPSGQVEATLEIVGRWLRGERNGRRVTQLQPEDIGIFYPRLVDRALLDRLLAGLCELAPTRWLSRTDDPAAHHGVNDAAIKVQTIHAAKGLQYKAVIVLWTDALPSGSELDDSERRLLYVAITRAENDLVLLGSRGRAFSSGLDSPCEMWTYDRAALRPSAA